MPNPTTRRTIRVFLSSPGDVSEERALAIKLIEHELRKDPTFHDYVALECVAWNDPDAPTPMLATKVPQVSVNEAKPSPAQCDIVVVVLWSRLGSPFELGGTKWASGTEWEYEDASRANPQPDILVYHRTSRPSLHDLDPGDPDFLTKAAQRQAQYRALRDFLTHRIQNRKTDYTDPTEFHERLEKDLRARLARLLRSPDQPSFPVAPFA